MAVIRPFRAVRPQKDVAHLVASVPYDVVNRDEAAELAKDNKINFLRVTRSELEFDSSVEAYSQEVYDKAKENFELLRTTAPLITEEKEHFYIYKLTWKGQSQAGIAATFAVDEYNNNVILKHEKTRKVKEDDRTKHIVTTETQTGAVFLTYKGIDEVNDVVDKTISQNPLYDFTTPDEVRHEIWKMPEDYNDVVVFELEKSKSLYIADGHHRAASAGRSQKVMMDKNPNHTGKEEYNYFMAVLFPAEQLKILPYNRTVYTLNGLTNEEFIEKIKGNFDVEECDSPDPEKSKNIKLYIDKKWYLLTPNDNVKKAEGIGDNLDVSILQNYLFTPILNIKDPRTDKNIDFIGGIRGTDELVKLVDSGKALAAFSMYPVSIQDLINISDAGEIMPPKSTWFEPKLRDGLLVHTI